jgi:hypothetical protein
MLAALITWNVAVASFFSLQWLSWNECITGAMVVVGTALGAFVESLLHKIAQRGNTELLIHGLMPIALLFATLLWMLFSLICPDASDCQLPVQTKAMSTLSICLLALMLASGSMAHMTASDSLKRIVISTIFAVVPFGTLLAIGAIGDLFYPYYASACLLLMVGIVGLACLSTLIGYKLRCLLPTPPLPRQSIS